MLIILLYNILKYILLNTVCDKLLLSVRNDLRYIGTELHTELSAEAAVGSGGLRQLSSRLSLWPDKSLYIRRVIYQHTVPMLKTRVQSCHTVARLS